MLDYIPYFFRKCNTCGEILWINKFHIDKDCKYNRKQKCKYCRSKHGKEYRSREDIKERYKKYREDNHEELLRKSREYREKNKELLQQRRDENRDEINRKHREWYANNKEKERERVRQWGIDNPEKLFNKNHRKRQQEDNQGNGFDKDQWYEMMCFFDWKCAYSGENLSNHKDRSVDHIIPIINGGENEIWNMVPMVRSYNSSKNARDMLEWYQEQEFYSEERLMKIIEWTIYAYDKWGK